ncbi:MAG: D-2-hydroxyacid dehydrogenase [Terracidiphilus sp.]|jgi:phosphoglycerate dehydrogenase-like enzyme
MPQLPSNDQPLVLVLAAENEPQLAMLSTIRHVVGAKFEDVAGAVSDAEVILHWSGDREILRQVFLACPRLRWVHSRNAGIDSLLFPELIRSPIPLTNGSGVFSQSLGEFALAAILYFAKDFPRMLRNQRLQRWEQFDVDEVAGQTVGIVGYGDIGRAVATRAKAMGMKVLALKRHAAAEGDPAIDRFYSPPKMLDMLGSCDYVVVAAPLTSETRHMVSDAEFAAMKPSAVVINIGRGPVIDQAALVRALVQKQIRGAGLDVFEQEPIPAGDPIWSLDNVLISPHTADHTSTWLNRAIQFFLAQYHRFSNGEPLENVVNKHLGY